MSPRGQPGLEQSGKRPSDHQAMSKPEMASGNCKPARAEPRAEPALLNENYYFSSL